jgi:hypothetical protein
MNCLICGRPLTDPEMPEEGGTLSGKTIREWLKGKTL